MHLKDCKEWSRVKVWVSKDMCLHTQKLESTDTQLETTIGAHKNNFTLLVWQFGTMINGIHQLPGTMISPPWYQVEADLVAKGYVGMGYWAESDAIECELISGSTATVIAQKHTKVEPGMACKRCHTFCHWSEPNQKDGSFICYVCRS
jgi:hypothetical protein